MNNKLRDKNVDFLFKSILALETLEECYNFFEDLCTVAEIKAMSQRIQLQKCSATKSVYRYSRIYRGEYGNYQPCNRSLHYGCDGYEKIFKRVDVDLYGDNEKKEKVDDGE